MRWNFAPCLLFMALIPSASAAEPVRIDLSKIDRSISREPEYVHAPHYALIVFGPQASHRSWLVMDGDDVLYFDRNGNGDLTDPEDRIEFDDAASRKIRLASTSSLSAMTVFPVGMVAGVDLQFQFWVRKKGFIPDDDRQRQLLRERETNNWENGTLWRLTANGGRSQNPVLLTATRAEAQVSHLNGPLTFALKWGDGQRLRPWPRSTVFDVHIGTVSLPARNAPNDLFAALTEWEVPREVHPVAVIEFPSKTPGAPPIVRTIELEERCCGDTIYARMIVPREAAEEGKAWVTLRYAKWTDGAVQPATFELPIGGEPRDYDEETSFVMFDDPAESIGLDAAVVALRKLKLSVEKVSGKGKDERNGMIVMIKDEPAFIIRLDRAPQSLEMAKALGEGTEFEKVLNRSQSRFEITIYPAKLVVRESETLKRIHAALQAATKGIVYTAWDRRLTGPE